MMSAGTRVAAGAIVASLAVAQGGCQLMGSPASNASAADAAQPSVQAEGATATDVRREEVRAIAASLSVRLRGLQAENSELLYAAEAEVRDLAQRLEVTEGSTPANDVFTRTAEPVWGVPTPAPINETLYAEAPRLPAGRSLMHGLRLAVYTDASSAASGWQKLAREHAALLTGLSPRLELMPQVGQGMQVELKVGPFSNRDDAEVRCAALAASGVNCVLDDFTGTTIQSGLDASTTPRSGEG
jgi:hypothetical protein